VEGSLPGSVGIIPDGNRRWAAANGVPLAAAYLRGARVAEAVVDYLVSVGVSRVFVYVLSADNCARRPHPELEAVAEAVRLGMEKARAWARRRGVTLVAVGDSSLMPPSVQDAVNGILWGGGRPPEPFVVLAVCYSPEWEERAYGCSATLKALGEIDLVFRSGGARRLSGFFPRLTLYSELYFSDKLWPDVTIDDVREALRWYARRDRRRGA
jgi:undecaprenyl pyrophosphate synthase